MNTHLCERERLKLQLGSCGYDTCLHNTQAIDHGQATLSRLREASDRSGSYPAKRTGTLLLGHIGTEEGLLLDQNRSHACLLGDKICRGDCRKGVSTARIFRGAVTLRDSATSQVATSGTYTPVKIKNQDRFAWAHPCIVQSNSYATYHAIRILHLP